MRPGLSFGLPLVLAIAACSAVLPSVTLEQGSVVRPAADGARQIPARGTIEGMVLVPPNVSGPGLIGQDGAALIGQDGAGLISRTKLIWPDGDPHAPADRHLLATLPEAPLAQSEVVLAESGGKPLTRVPRQRTDAQGRFRLVGVPTNFSFMIKVGITGQGGRPAILTTLVRAQTTPVIAEVTAATTLVAAALTEGQARTVGAFDPGHFRRAAQAVAERLSADHLPDWSEPAAVQQAIKALAEAHPTIKSALAELRQEVATNRPSAESLDALEEALPPVPATGKSQLPENLSAALAAPPEGPAGSLPLEPSGTTSPLRFDAAADFRGDEPPAHGWHYSSVSGQGTLDTSLQPAAFPGGPMWVGTNGCSIGLLPGPALGLTPDATNDPVVRWRAPRAGSPSLSVAVHLMGSSSDGVRAVIQFPGGRFVERTLSDTIPDAELHEPGLPVAPGDEFIFRVDSLGSASGDATSWRITFMYPH